MPDGSWKEILHDMGFPAGLPRTIVVDLTGKLPVGATHLRIRTNLQIYWDQILIDNEANQPASLRQTELPLAKATLAFHGYPKQIDGATPGDLTYDYQSISATGPLPVAARQLHALRRRHAIASRKGQPIRHLRQRRRH